MGAALATASTTRQHVISEGSLVTLDLYRAPLVKGKIARVLGDGTVDVLVTADAGAYRKGETVEGLRVDHQVVARAAVVRSRTRTGHYAIRGTTVLAPAL